MMRKGSLAFFHALLWVRVEWVVALFMLVLAYLTLTARSLTVIRFDEWGVRHEFQAVLWVMGAGFAGLSRGRDGLFFLGTLPLLAHVALSIVIILQSRGGYHTAALYGLTLTLLYLLYARQELCDE